LKVPVSVNDGQNESKKFDLKVDVQKAQSSPPQITGQKALTMTEDEALAISLTDLTVVDTDNTYPQGFTLKISNGPHYSVSGTTIIPEKDYSGTLSVTLRVNDGKNDSAPFKLQITVSPVNDAPLITGQKKLETNQATPLSIALGDLTVTDPDNKFPDDFSLTILPGANYVAANNTINPTPTFSGILNVLVTVTDGVATSPPFTLGIDVRSAQTNVAPIIVGQRTISLTQGTPLTIQLFHLVVEDPDNEYPADFTLKIFPGTNYSVNGNRITPAPGFVGGTLSVGAKVNDGTDESPLFNIKINVIPISATPVINGQRDLTMTEDSTLTIELADLVVTDVDNPDYPRGFTLKVLNDNKAGYTTSGNTIRPSADLNGYIEVGVTVSDGKNTSEKFGVVIFVEPVNDAPRITLLDASPLAFEPGNEPAEIFSRLVLADVDNEFLSMAEIGIRQPNFSPTNDQILFDFDSTKLRPIRDQSGILFLVGFATVQEYQTALRSIRYNYQITMDQNGQPDGILSGSRTIYVNVNDGQLISLNSERRIDIEGRIALDIPSAFTPNGDMANDTWHLEISNKDLDQAIIRVYNKRGLLIYESDGFDKDWDGTFNGQLLPADTYFYTIDVKLPYVRQKYNGVVTILY
jgi:gliding motility-associated-like protein